MGSGALSCSCRPGFRASIANVQSNPPEAIEYRGNAQHLQEVWIAVRANLRAVLEEVTLADLVSGDLPTTVMNLAAAPDSWAAR